MQSTHVTGLALVLSLAFIMFSLGLGLTGADFKRIVAQPKALLVGVVCHFVVLPLVCFGLLHLTGMTGVFAVGFMLVAACPTGSTSNLLTYIARGDVALAVSFTAVASLLTVLTLPVVMTWSIQYFLGAERSLNVPVQTIAGQLLALLALPVGSGMLVARLKPDFAKRFEPKAARISTILFVVIVIMAAVKSWDIIRDNFATLAPFALTLNVTMLLIGFVAAWAVRLSRQQSVTLGIESAMQNAALAMVVASTVLKDETMVIPGAIYGLMMYVGGLAFSLVMRRFIAAAPATA